MVKVEIYKDIEPKVEIHVGDTFLPFMSSKFIQQVLAFLNGLACTQATPIVPATQAPGTHPIVTTACMMNGNLGTDMFFRGGNTCWGYMFSYYDF